MTQERGRERYIGASAIWQISDLSAAPSGRLLQVQESFDGTVNTGTNNVPFDNTIPQQSTDVNIFYTVSITPAATTNLLIIEAILNFSSPSTRWAGVGIFQDATENALAFTWDGLAANDDKHSYLTYSMLAGTVASTTFKLGAGVHTTGTITINGTGGSQLMGGAYYSGIRVTEWHQ
jgi:hypothetical protein